MIPNQTASLADQTAMFPYTPQSLDEIVWPSSNAAGIPDLVLAHQATELPAVITTWGSVSRTTRLDGGCYGFYTDDYRFEGLWSNPDALLRSGVTTIIEPNFSVRPRMPIAVAAYQIFRKRWLSRYYQSHGVNVIVDLNVAPNYAAANLCGVPRGWRAYATRAHKGMHSWLPKEFALAQQHADSENILFLVYGGECLGETHRLCLERGWAWAEDRMSSARRALTSSA